MYHSLGKTLLNQPDGKNSVESHNSVKMGFPREKQP